MRFKILLAVFLIGLTFFLYPHFVFLKKDLKISIFKTLFSFNSIKKVNSQTNILILGIPGGNYEGPDLTDSIILANYNFRKNRLTTIGIPRDIWSNSLKDRINTAYAYGEAKKKDGGLTLARAEAAKFVGFPIQYAVVIDFSQFEELIDFLGGVKVNVENSFVDKKFPIEGKENDDCGGKDPEFLCRYETVSFQKGESLMSGDTALKYVRSRNALGDEGGDFARGRRQQEVMNAVWGKVIRQTLRFNTNKNRQLYQLLDKSVERDLSNQQASIIVKNMILKGKLKQKNITLPREFFEVPNVSVFGKYTLIAQNADHSKIQEYIRCEIEQAEGKKCL